MESMEQFIGSRLVRIGDLGVGGKLYGGRMLEFLAEQAAVFAVRITGKRHLAGYRFDNVVLSRPVGEGEIVEFYGEVKEFRRCSVTFFIHGRVGGAAALEAECTFVNVDEKGCKQPLKES